MNKIPPITVTLLAIALPFLSLKLIGLALVLAMSAACAWVDVLKKS